MAVRHGYGKIAGTDALVFAYDTGDTRNSYKGKPTTNFISNPTEEMPRGEFGQYRDLAPTFETYGLVPYSLSMDIKTNIPGNVYVYMQNGSTSRHGFVGANVSATTEYQRFYFENLTPTLNDPGTAASTLATYTGYGSGVNPTVKNIQLELGAYSTPFVDGTRSATQGLLDLTGNESIDLSNVSFDSNAQMTFDGTNDGINILAGSGIFTNSSFAVEAVLKYTNNGQTQVYFSTGAPISINGGIHLRIYSTNGLLRMGFYGDDLNTSAGAITPNKFQHIVMQYDYSSDISRIYVNGNQKATGSNGPYTPETSQPTIGYAPSPYSEYLQGELPIMKIYNRALTADEVRNNYRHYKTRFDI